MPLRIILWTSFVVLSLIIAPGCSREETANHRPAKVVPQGKPPENWLLPYVGEEVVGLEAVDFTRLGRFAAQREQLMPIIPNFKNLPDLANVQRLAELLVRWDADRVTSVIIGQCDSAPADALVEGFGQYLRPLEILVDGEPVKGGPLEIQSTVDGHLFFVGSEFSIKSVMNRSGGKGPIADRLRSLGNHLYVNLRTLSQEDRKWGNEHYVANPDLLDSYRPYYKLMFASSAIATTFDADPQLALQAHLELADPTQASELIEVGQSQLDLLRQIAEDRYFWRDTEFTQVLKKKLVLRLAAEGQFLPDPQGIRFEWKASPESTERLHASIPQMLANAAQSQQDYRRRVVMLNTMQALAQFMVKHDHFPTNICSADGEPLMSWRVRLLSALDANDIYRQLRMDEPWNSPHNASLLAKVHARLFAGHADTPDDHADILAVVGQKDFSFLPNQVDGPPVKSDAFTDGLEKTVMVVLVDPNRSVPWAKPDDFVWDPAAPHAGLGLDGENRFQVLLGDNNIIKVSREEAAATLRAMFGRNDGQKYELKPVD